MIRIFVFDTNAIISAHLLRSSISRSAYDHALEKGIIACSKETLDEFNSTFERKKFDKYISPAERKQNILAFEKMALLVDVTSKVDKCRDKKDNKFLELAVDSLADCIITGDNDLLVLHPFMDIPILSPKDFINNF